MKIRFSTKLVGSTSEMNSNIESYRLSDGHLQCLQSFIFRVSSWNNFNVLQVFSSSLDLEPKSLLEDPPQRRCKLRDINSNFSLYNYLYPQLEKFLDLLVRLKSSKIFEEAWICPSKSAYNKFKIKFTINDHQWSHHSIGLESDRWVYALNKR